MTKQELIDKIGDIYNALSDAQSNAKALAHELSRIESSLEDLPSEVDEIEDFEKESE